MVQSDESTQRPRRSIWQWFWRSEELARARQALRDVPAAEREQLKRAQAALELAERCVNPVDPLSAGPSLPLALSLYREAAYWALSAQQSGAAPADLADAFARTPDDLLAFAAGGGEGLSQLKSALIEKSFRETADDSLEQQRSDARQADVFVKALIDRRLGPERRVGRALVQRWMRTLLGVVLLASVLFGALALYSAHSRAPNLAQGKPWQTSSSNQSVPTAQRNEYFFHTLDEDSPWVELDLQRPAEFSVVEVVNRRDCCPERAAPAVIEVSMDRKRWKEVSRRNDSYSVWEAHFAPVRARYVRVRVIRRSILHLAEVAVRAR
jgi:hypothetical protein